MHGSVTVHVSRRTKFSSDSSIGLESIRRDPPPVRRGTSASPFSELRKSISIIFGFLKSPEVDFSDFVFFVVFSL